MAHNSAAVSAIVIWFKKEPDVQTVPLPAGGLLGAAADQPSCRSAQRLEGKDAVKHAVMTDARLSCTATTNTGEYRIWLQGRCRQKISDLASAIKQAADELAEIGLLQEDKDKKRKEAGRFSFTERCPGMR